MPKACIYAGFRYLLYQMHLVDDNIPLEGVFHGYDELDNERIHLDFCWLSTIGGILAERMSWQFIDNEDLYFPKEDASYLFSNPRSKEEVIHLLEEKIEEDDRFVFAAVKGDYGEKLLTKLDYVVLIEVPKETRMERVKMRSVQKFGDRIQEQGDLADTENAWFSVVNSRPENFVTEWLECVPCPVIRIDGTAPVEENVDYLLRKL